MRNLANLVDTETDTHIFYRIRSGLSRIWGVIFKKNSIIFCISSFDFGGLFLAQLLISRYPIVSFAKKIV